MAGRTTGKLFGRAVSGLKRAAAVRRQRPGLALAAAALVACNRVRHTPVQPQAAAGNLPAMLMQAFAATAAAAARVPGMGSRGLEGDYKETSEIIAAGVRRFQPGGDSSSYYTEDIVAVTKPFFTLVACSSYLTGQVVVDLLSVKPGAAAGAAGSGGQQYGDDIETSAKALLENCYAVVEWLGSQLCQVPLPGDGDSSSSSSSNRAVLQRLLDQHAQLQQGLFDAAQRCIAPSIRASRGSAE